MSKIWIVPSPKLIAIDLESGAYIIVMMESLHSTSLEKLANYTPSILAPLNLHPTRSALLRFTPEKSALEKLECWKTPFFMLAPLMEMLEKSYPARQIWAATRMVMALAPAVMA
jgi:hypothetical protein